MRHYVLLMMLLFFIYFFVFCFLFFVFVFCFLLFVFCFLFFCFVFRFLFFVFAFCFLLFAFCFLFFCFVFVFVFFLLFAFCFLLFVFCFLFFVFVFLQTNLLRKTNRLVPFSSLRTSEETILFNFIEKRNRKTGEFAVSTRNSYKRLFFACLLPLTSGYIKALNVSSPWKQSVSFLSNGNNQSRFPRV